MEIIVTDADKILLRKLLDDQKRIHRIKDERRRKSFWWKDVVDGGDGRSPKTNP